MDRLVPDPSPEELREVVRLKHVDGDPARYGWATRMRLKFDYFTPDEYYEFILSRLVTEETSWLDVGCGRNIFPSNTALARTLASRCKVLVGVDPDPTIEENPFVHEKIRGTLGDIPDGRQFDVVTMRMVAEHIVEPEETVRALERVIVPGGLAVIYTVNRWSPLSVLSRLTPFWLHHPIKKRVWRTEDKDTFPVAYRMNSRRSLRRLFEGSGFHESSFSYLDDCRTFANTRPILFLELTARATFRKIKLKYPENCILGIYKKSQ